LKNSILAKHYWIGDAENMIRLLMNRSTTIWFMPAHRFNPYYVHTSR
jgi:hypothetical protein